MLYMMRPKICRKFSDTYHKNNTSQRISLPVLPYLYGMTRKEFISQVGSGAALLLLPACILGLEACKKNNKSNPSTKNVDFTLDVSSGPLATNGGSFIQNGVIVARTNSGNFIAVDAACTHAGTIINYSASTNSFNCPNHGAKFDSQGHVTLGPASVDLKSYQTSLSGSSLRVFS
jgi:cytochrome b6-f complex iron-sulfur subunit